VCAGSAHKLETASTHVSCPVQPARCALDQKIHQLCGLAAVLRQNTVMTANRSKTKGFGELARIRGNQVVYSKVLQNKEVTQTLLEVSVIVLETTRSALRTGELAPASGSVGTVR
jgi:hypothetical protein